MALQSFGGAAWHNRGDDGRPGIYPVSFIDFGAGMALVQGILLALLERSNSGRGQRVGVSLIDTVVFQQMQEVTAWMMRRHEVHWKRDNLVGVFRTADGWVTIAGLFRPILCARPATPRTRSGSDHPRDRRSQGSRVVTART